MHQKNSSAPQEITSLLTLLGCCAILTVTLCLSAHQSWACGGFFCNANNPVTQSAERILFARDTEAGEIAMHIQIQYEGPPTEFGWILPTAPGVETTTSKPWRHVKKPCSVSASRS